MIAGGPDFGSERTVELFCGKSLFTETATCFSICERWSPLAGNTALCAEANISVEGNQKQSEESEFQSQTSVRS